MKAYLTVTNDDAAELQKETLGLTNGQETVRTFSLQPSQVGRFLHDLITRSLLRAMHADGGNNCFQKYLVDAMSQLLMDFEIKDVTCEQGSERIKGRGVDQNWGDLLYLAYQQVKDETNTK